MKIFMKMAAVLLVLAFVPTFVAYAQSEVAPLAAEIVAGTGNVGHQDGFEATFHMPVGILIVDGNIILVADKFNNLLRTRMAVELLDFSDVYDEEWFEEWLYAMMSTHIFAGYVSDFFPIGTHVDGVVWEAGLFHPTGLTMCRTSGRIYVADASNNSIRVIIDFYRMYTLSGWGEAGFADGPRGTAAFNSPTSIAVHPSGYLYVADSLNHVIRRVSPDGYTTTIAGMPQVYGYRDGSARSALFDTPKGIAIASDGRIFVADTGNHLIRVIENGVVRTFAGGFELAEGEDDWENVPAGGFIDGAANNARFNQPWGLALWGNYLIVADSSNHAIRMVSPNGRVETLEIIGLHFPMGVYVHGNSLFIADSGNNKIRMVVLD